VSDETTEVAVSDETTVVTTTKPKRQRRVLVLGIIVLAAVVLLAGTMTTWVRRQALNTNEFVKASDRMLERPEIRSALSFYIVDQLYQAVDIAGELKKDLPDNLQGLAGPVAAGLRTPAATAVDRLLATSQVRVIWHTVVSKAHVTLVRVLKGQPIAKGTTTTANGTVVLNVRDLVVLLGDRLGLPSAVLDRIPADVGQITVVKSSDLSVAQDGVKLVERMSVLLFLVVVALLALAVYLAAGWRRVALRDAGLAILVVGLLTLMIQRLIGNYVVNSLTKLPANRPAVRVSWLITTSLLRGIAWSTVTVGLLVILAAALAGATRPAIATRRFLAPAFAARPALLWGGTAIVVLLVSLWAPLPVLSTWYGFLIFVAVGFGGVEAMRRQCAREFPDASFTDVSFAGARNAPRALAGAMRSATDRLRRSSTPASSVDEIARLHELHLAGALTDEEFSAAKRALLSDVATPVAPPA